MQFEGTEEFIDRWSNIDIEEIDSQRVDCITKHYRFNLVHNKQVLKLRYIKHHLNELSVSLPLIQFTRSTGPN